MNHDELRALTHQGIDRHCAMLVPDPYRVQRVLDMAHGEGKKKVKKRFSVAFALVMIVLLSTAAALAWSLSREYFADIARITFTSGDYESWSLEEKRCMMTIMGKYGLLSEAESKKLSRQSEKEIDRFMLDRYGLEGGSEGLGAISLTRIAWVEMGPYTDWDNETWVWYSKLMFEVGLWNETSDVDVYEVPGDEAIPPEEAVRLAEEYLINQGIERENVENAWRVWHYMTHASDVERQDMTYCITFRFADESETYVFLTPMGTIR